MSTGAADSGNTDQPRCDPSDDRDEFDVDFDRGLERVRAALSTRPPYLGRVFERFYEWVRRRPLRFVELHGAQGLTRADRRRLEARLTLRLQAYVLVVGALLVWMDLPSLRSGKLVAGERVFGLGQEHLAEVTGLSLTRLRRAIADLVAAGYLTWKQPIARYVKPGAPGGVGHAAWFAIYRFELRFFERLQLDGALAKNRRRAVERRANRVRIYAASLLRAREALRRARQHLRRPLEVIGQPTRWRPPRPPRPKP